MELRFEQNVPCSLEEVFAFHTNPENLKLLMWGWPAFRLLHHSGGIHVGAQTWVEIRVFRIIPMVLGFVHTRFEPQRSFAEELIHGVFQGVQHVHEFDSFEGGTRIRDTMRITFPWYYGGEIGVRNLVEPGIRKLFAYRHQALKRLIDEKHLRRIQK